MYLSGALVSVGQECLSRRQWVARLVWPPVERILSTGAQQGASMRRLQTDAVSFSFLPSFLVLTHGSNER